MKSKKRTSFRDWLEQQEVVEENRVEEEDNKKKDAEQDAVIGVDAESVVENI